ncbi:MAG: EamA family transporter [Marinovum algicola]|uniref:EamA-like transporter family protein n=1 Tax=Marinovum algicola TaxID=42444 RepID=A0A975ZMB5_9RHOB|nr:MULTISPECIES: EamA family transporter [Marinovum]AKO96232.1 putative nucleoside-diphosphate sugar epimerase [Marinovum algicola DG 898]MDD9738712.1 EamA family transporter [Marinovum sp. SP66]MDD9746117.1 EamA family transporter [Marinovum sp. PR37]SEI95031.1 EamA-like transporter family protein [Marinovum algicola]SLN10653.1 EamA-like transporter family protein [Marinovum algicola]
MSEWLISLEGTEAGHRLALILAVNAAFLHAVFGALQKGRHDPWLSRGAIDGAYGLMAAPFALFVVPWPEPHMWPIFAGAFVIHTAYKLLQAMAYTRGAYTVVYPVVRGTGPLFAVIGAYLIFDESFTLVQWLGVGVLLAGIFGLAVYNLIFLTAARETLNAALALAVFTGLFVALYTTYDAYGIRATADPFTFLAWFFMIDGVVMPVLAARRWRRAALKPPLRPLLLRGWVGGLIAFASFGAIMLATRLDKVGEAAVLRETSTVFAALIGWLVLKETVGPRRIALMALIAAGAVIVEMGG